MKLSKKMMLSSLMLSSLMLTACSSLPKNVTSLKSPVIEYSNKKVTIEDAYNLAISQKLIQSPLHEVVITDVFAELYGDKVSKEDIEAQFNSMKVQYQTEEEFDNALKLVGLTQKTYKQQLKATLAYQVGLTELLEVKDDNLKTLFENYVPNRKVNVAVFEKEEDAQSFANSVSSGTDFMSKAKEGKSISYYEVSFDSYEDVLPEDVLKAIDTLEIGSSTKAISYTNEAYGLTSYFVVQLIEKTEKESDWKKYKDRLTEVYRYQQLSNEDVVNSLEKKALSKVNFKVTSDDFKEVFSEELNAK